MTAPDLDALAREIAGQRVKPHGPIVVDPQDQHFVTSMPWRRDAQGYARATGPCAKGSRSGPTLHLHRLIVACAPGQIVDHINGDVLDNRRSNLRLCTKLQNNRNVGLRADSSTGFKGVARRSDVRSGSGVYKAHIRVNGKKLHLGSFAVPEDAAAAYDAAARQAFGDFARLNFPTAVHILPERQEVGA